MNPTTPGTAGSPRTARAPRARRRPALGLATPLAATVLLTACGTAHSSDAPAAEPARPAAAPSPAVSLPSIPPLTVDGSAPSPSAASSSPVCPGSGVSLAAEEANAAMGLRVMTLRLTNCGTATRVLNGYPDVRVLDAGRKPLAVDVRHGASDIMTDGGFDAGPVRVALRPGEQAVTGLVWRNTVTDGTPANGAYVSLAPSAGADRLTVPSLIDLGTTGKLGVSAWARG
ncbi:DUF4232 domain-containing protein [Streptomyces sp. HU2014]|uniref:DUF4232 domain-containing protein n=1 Tax=Streptomyces sp. HU2014 TaxID=2939414 RepID=UPI002010A796|nr:DUF4232 domain-containing protein [Streptomyces sp. HU2014]UQI45117.1 DUF4232 domain-containing protein [Streptomyces sp. HU2014]